MSPNTPSEGWYKTINPNEHIYTAGYGFSQRPPFLVERALIQSYAGGVGLACLFFFAFRGLLHSLAYWLIRSLAYALTPWVLISNQACLSIASCLAYSAALGLPFLFYGAYVRIPASSAVPAGRLSGRLILPAVFIGLCTSAVGYASMTITGRALESFGLSHLSSGISLPADPLALLFYCLSVTLLPALLEEAVFRGVVLQSLRRFGDGFALLCSAAAFAMMHGNLLQFGNAFLMGLVIGYFVLMSGSLWIGVILHFVNNLLVLLLGSLPYLITPTASQAVMLGAYALYIVGGVIALLHLTRHTTGLFDLRPARTSCTEGQKIRYFFTSPAFVVCLFTALASAVQMIRLVR